MIQEIRHTDGDLQSFDGIFRRYYQVLSYFAQSLLSDRALSEDIVQSVFVSVLHGSVTFENDLHAKQYLYKAVRNACVNELKSLNTKADILERFHSDLKEDDDFGLEPDLLRTVVKAEVYREILDAVESLPTECGKVFRLAYLENLNNQEIADLLNLSINTVKVQKNNAKKRLRRVLRDLYPLVFLIS